MALRNGDSLALGGLRLRVEYVAAPFWSAPGFAIPIFTSGRGSNTIYTQRADFYGKIIDFDEFVDNRSLVKIKDVLDASIGDQEIFAIIDPLRVAHAGTREILADHINQWISDIETPFSRLNFAVFCGNERIAKKAAAEAVDAKASEFGKREHAISWFINGFVVAELVRAILRSRDFRKDANDAVRDVWSAIKVTVDKKITIEYKMQAEGDGEREIAKSNDLKNILSLARTASRLDVQFVIMGKSDVDNLGERKSDKSASEYIELIPRQEERIAKLIELVLLRGNSDKEILRNYAPKAKYERKAVDLLQEALRNSNTPLELLREVVRLTSELISSAYPPQRGRVLWEFARILGAQAEIAKIIREIVKGSKSLDILSVRDEILSELGKK